MDSVLIRSCVEPLGFAGPAHGHDLVDVPGTSLDMRDQVAGRWVELFGVDAGERADGLDLAINESAGVDQKITNRAHHHDAVGRVFLKP
jgi:hypothetical protein